MDPRRPFSHSPSNHPRPRQGFSLKRWYKGKRDVSTWDGLRRDIDLFDDCAEHPVNVYLFARGQSQRGAAFRVPARKFVDARCDSLLENAHQTVGEKGAELNLYLPAPVGLLREDVLQHHVATRNFFAWLMRRPLVGQSLGKAMGDLLDRMNSWRSTSEDNVEDLLIYADRMGYSAVEHRPDNALAMLAFSERARIGHVWIDSFAHCTGMNAEIGRSPEFDGISRATKALITRAYLEMDLHLDRASRQLVTFLETDLSASYLGLSEGARHHLDTFRSFLHAFYVGRFGYWPPYSPTNYPKDLYHDMYDDFNCLYNLLADKDYAGARSNSLRSADGGICVEQNIEAFNQRHKCNALPHTMPLVPERLSLDARTKSQKNLLAFRFGKDASIPRGSKTDQMKFALRAATNQDNESITQSSLVQQYLEWEEQHASRTDGKVSVGEARKVRWILIYGLLQTLVSAIQAPAEVRDTTTADYPLCILTDGLPPWSSNEPALQQAQKLQAAEEDEPPLSASSDKLSLQPTPPTPALSIHPDAEAENYFNYWTSEKPAVTDNATGPPKAALKRAGSRLRKASIKRRSLQAVQTQMSTKPELVSGRTLAELGYGDHGVSSIDNSPVATGFDFGFPEPDDASSRRESGEVSSTSSPVVADQGTSFDDLHSSLPSHMSSVPRGEIDDSSSIPSLTYSHGSRDTVDSIPSEHMPSPDRNQAFAMAEFASDVLAKEAAAHDEDAAKRANDSDATDDKALDAGEGLPTHVVTGFTDFFAKPDTGGTDSDSSSLSDYVDRAAVIQSDGSLDRDFVDRYRAMTVS